MLYREMGKTGDKISILGFGGIQFPRVGGNNRMLQFLSPRIDDVRTEKLILSAIDHGVNYFDTAYSYTGSETVLGKILARGHRNKVMIATKLPVNHIQNLKEMEMILDTQLKRLQTDHVDYYLMHGLMSIKRWQTVRQLGIESFLEKAKRTGKIRHIGFSYHGDRNQFKNIIDDYPWEFCQIQYSYLDEKIQAGTEGLAYAASKGLGVVVMQPLRNGVLTGQFGAKMPKEVQAAFDQAKLRRTAAEWGLRWVWDHPEVTVALSGMREVSYIEENSRVADSAHPFSLTTADLEIIEKAKKVFDRITAIKCNACGYCMPCSEGVNIPLCFQLYNDYKRFGWIYKFMYAFFSAQRAGEKPIYASRCQNCGKCEQRCTQSLPIRAHLREVAVTMEPLYFRPMAALMSLFFFRRLTKPLTESQVFE